MNQDRPYWDMKVEPLLNTPEMKKIQLEKLKRMLTRMKDNAPFFTRTMEKNKLDPEELRDFEELKEKMPLFTKETMRQVVEGCENDYLKAVDQIIPVSVDELEYVATTTGTTGVPTPYPLSYGDTRAVFPDRFPYFSER